MQRLRVMGSSVSKGSLGSDRYYTKQLYFDPEADLGNGSVYWIDDDDLLRRIAEVADVKEKIDQVFIFRHPIYFWQVTTSHFLPVTLRFVTLTKSSDIQFIFSSWWRHVMFLSRNAKGRHITFDIQSTLDRRQRHALYIWHRDTWCSNVTLTWVFQYLK